MMQRSLRLSSIGFSFVVLALAAPGTVQTAAAANEHDALVAKHAAAHGVPESLVRRVILRESRGNARAVSKGNYGLMQIRLGTARAMGYSGGAAGLLDADTNMTYAVKYLAGAYRAAGGNADRAVRYYQGGYYYQAKARGFSPYAEPVTMATAPVGALRPNRTEARLQAPAGTAAAMESGGVRRE
jgi:soluble lytic murein transglycosylase-like protein